MVMMNRKIVVAGGKTVGMLMADTDGERQVTGGRKLGSRREGGVMAVVLGCGLRRAEGELMVGIDGEVGSGMKGRMKEDNDKQVTLISFSIAEWCTLQILVFDVLDNPYLLEL